MTEAAGAAQYEQPADHPVTLNYTADGLMPEPALIFVRDGQTIAFQLGTAPPDSSFRVTFSDARHLSSPVYEQGDPPIVVQGQLTARVTFDCELIPDPEDRPGRGAGGAIEDDKSHTRGS